MPEAKYITSPIDSQNYCITNGQFTKHLRKNGLTYQSYYETYVTRQPTPLCSCSKPLTFYQTTHTYANSCGDPKCVGNTVSKTKSSWTDEQRALDSANKKAAAALKTKDQIKQSRQKASQTFKQKYGVEWAAQSGMQKNKSKQTKLERYGNEHYSGWEKSAAKNRSKTAEEQEAINQTRRQTNLEKFGVECSWLKPESIANSRKSNALGKDYILPSGKVVGIRGHEDKALDRLFALGYKEDEILIHDNHEVYKLPVFKYVDTRRHHMNYYPDIYIPKENKIIEVKSPWWWDGNGNEKYKSRLENNLRKRAAVLKESYTYEVWIFDPGFKEIL